MPRFDRTGPRGQGPMTGRGFGSCKGLKAPKRGLGRGLVKGLGQGPKGGQSIIKLGKFSNLGL